MTTRLLFRHETISPLVSMPQKLLASPPDPNTSRIIDAFAPFRRQETDAFQVEVSENILVPPDFKDVLPNFKDVLPNFKDVLPDFKDVPAGNKDVLPDFKDVPAKNKNVLPDFKDGLPDFKDGPAKNKDVLRNFKDGPAGNRHVLPANTDGLPPLEDDPPPLDGTPAPDSLPSPFAFRLPLADRPASLPGQGAAPADAMGCRPGDQTMPDKQQLAEQTLHALGIPVQASYFSTGSTVTAEGWHAARDAAQAMRMRLDQAHVLLEREAATDPALAGRLREAIELLKGPAGAGRDGREP